MMKGNQQNCFGLVKIGQSSNSLIFELQIPLDNGSRVDSSVVFKQIKHSLQTKDGTSTFRCSQECEQLAKEHRILSQIDHPHIIKLKDQFIQKENFFCGIILEKAKKDLYSAISEQELYNINDIKMIFKQILSSLKLLHDNGFSHNDVKLDNIFLFSEEPGKKCQCQVCVDDIPRKYSAKLADFGLANEINLDSDNWKNRNRQYLAPEILKRVYAQDQTIVIDKRMTDMFALGQCLFEAIFHRHIYSAQYKCAHPDDYYVKYLYEGNYIRFWSKILDNKQTSLLVENYKSQQSNQQLNSLLNLIIGLLTINPQNRMTVDEALNHPWFN